MIKLLSTILNNEKGIWFPFNIFFGPNSSFTCMTESSSGYYIKEQRRDLRIDFIRGLAMAIVVINHLPSPSYYYIFSMERIGVVSGAEIFVLLSGLALGFKHKKYIQCSDWGGSALKLLKRALLLYICLITVSLTVWLLSQVLPGFKLLTTWMDSTNTILNLYPEDAIIHPHKLLVSIATLQSVPWQFNIIALYIFLLGIAPLQLWLINKGKG